MKFGKSNENPVIMTRSTTVSLMLKRFSAIFLILFPPYFLFAENPPGPEAKPDNKVQIVVIDAGHGGRDPGAPGRNVNEKDIALKIALKAGQYIEENVEDVKVIYTRETDVFVPLYQRAQIANENKADLFISIHVNANTSSRPYGTSSHVLGLHRAEENFDVAVRENSVIMLEEDYETTYQGFDPDSEESYVIFSVMQNTYLNQSIEFASYVQDQFRDRAKRKDRGVKQQGLLVLARSAMPGVLIETGFITNPEEEKYLMSEYGQDIISSAVYRAFKQYKNRIEERSRFTAAREKEEAVTTGQKAPEPPTAGDNITFRIQVASSRSKVDTNPSAFKGYQDVKVYRQGRWYKYTVTGDTEYEKALEQCSMVKKDYPGAFVVAVKNGELIPLNEALVEINR